MFPSRKRTRKRTFSSYVCYFDIRYQSSVDVVFLYFSFFFDKVETLLLEIEANRIFFSVLFPERLLDFIFSNHVGRIKTSMLSGGLVSKLNKDSSRQI